MRRGAPVLLAGVAVGVATHLLFFSLHQPSDPGTLEGQLAWMRSELHLSDDQYGRIRELHEASSPRLRELAAQVAQMQGEFAAFEETRRSSDRVDFVGFAQFVEARRNVDRECLDSTHQLVMAAASEMTPGQRQHYFGIVALAEPLAGRSTN
jgi:hypothetical protein